MTLATVVTVIGSVCWASLLPMPPPMPVACMTFREVMSADATPASNTQNPARLEITFRVALGVYLRAGENHTCSEYRMA